MEEIEKDLTEKKNILNFVVKNNITNINEIGKIMNAYYTDIGKLRKIIKNEK